MRSRTRATNAKFKVSTAEELIRYSVWVAAFDSIVVGWVEVKVTTVKGLYVPPSSSRSGVGSILMAHAESAIQAKGEVAVSCSATDRTIYGVANLSIPSGVT